MSNRKLHDVFIGTICMVRMRIYVLHILPPKNITIIITRKEKICQIAIWIYTVHTSYNLNVTRVAHVCVDHEIHTCFCYTLVLLCFYLLHYEHVRKHTSYVCVYTCFFTHAHASHGIHAKCTQLHFYSLAS